MRRQLYSVSFSEALQLALARRMSSLRRRLECVTQTAKKTALCVCVHFTNFRLNFQPSGHEIKHGSADDEHSALTFPLMGRHRVRCRRVGVWLGRWLPWIARTRTIFEGV